MLRAVILRWSPAVTQPRRPHGGSAHTGGDPSPGDPRGEGVTGMRPHLAAAPSRPRSCPLLVAGLVHPCSRGWRMTMVMMLMSPAWHVWDRALWRRSRVMR